MLVLSRQKDETIVLILPDGTEIEVTVVDIRGDKVRLGVTAPKAIAVHREEVYKAIKAEGRKALSIRPSDLKPLYRVLTIENTFEVKGRGIVQVVLSSKHPGINFKSLINSVIRVNGRLFKIRQLECSYKTGTNIEDAVGLVGHYIEEP